MKRLHCSLQIRINNYIDGFVNDEALIKEIYDITNDEYKEIIVNDKYKSLFFIKDALKRCCATIEIINRILLMSINAKTNIHVIYNYLCHKITPLSLLRYIILLNSMFKRGGNDKEIIDVSKLNHGKKGVKIITTIDDEISTINDNDVKSIVYFISKSKYISNNTDIDKLTEYSNNLDTIYNTTISEINDVDIPEYIKNLQTYKVENIKYEIDGDEEYNNILLIIYNMFLRTHDYDNSNRYIIDYITELINIYKKYDISFIKKYILYNNKYNIISFIEKYTLYYIIFLKLLIINQYNDAADKTNYINILKKINANIYKFENKMFKKHNITTSYVKVTPEVIKILKSFQNEILK